MSECKQRNCPILLPGGRPPDLQLRGQKPAAGREQGKAAHASKPDRQAGRQQVKACAWSRLGLDVGKFARQTLIRRVQKGDVKYARRLTKSRTVIVLDYEDGEMAFLYSSATKEIVCFLAPDAPEIAVWRRSQAELAETRRRPDGAGA
jgi:hypothetical protein